MKIQQFINENHSSHRWVALYVKVESPGFFLKLRLGWKGLNKCSTRIWSIEGCRQEYELYEWWITSHFLVTKQNKTVFRSCLKTDFMLRTLGKFSFRFVKFLCWKICFSSDNFHIPESTSNLKLEFLITNVFISVSFQ